MTVKISEENKSVLRQLHNYKKPLFINASKNHRLEAAGLVTFSRDVVNPEDTEQVSTSLTKEGIAFCNAGSAEIDAVVEAPAPMGVGEPIIEQPIIEQPPAPKPQEEIKPGTFELFKGGELPRKSRRVKKEDLYPFASMELGQIFFVPVSDKKPYPAKSLGSTVAAASKRYAEVIGQKEVKGRGGAIKMVPEYKFERKFKVASVKKGYVCGEFTASEDGAIVKRIL